MQRSAIIISIIFLISNYNAYATVAASPAGESFFHIELDFQEAFLNLNTSEVFELAVQ